MISRRVALHPSGVGFKETPEGFKATLQEKKLVQFYYTLSLVQVLEKIPFLEDCKIAYSSANQHFVETRLIASLQEKITNYYCAEPPSTRSYKFLYAYFKNATSQTAPLLSSLMLTSCPSLSQASLLTEVP